MIMAVMYHMYFMFVYSYTKLNAHQPVIMNGHKLLSVKWLEILRKIFYIVFVAYSF